MFDISFSELLVIVVVALLVIGPEKLPKVARTLGAYAGRMQRFVAQVKDEVNREARFDELRKLQEEVKTAAFATQSSIMSQVASIEQSVTHASPEADQPVESSVKPSIKNTESTYSAVGEKKAKASVAKTATANEKSKPTRTRKKKIE